MRHEVMVGDSTKELEKLLRGRVPDVVYSDPPWDQGCLTMWRHYSGQERMDWSSWLQSMLDTIAGVGADTVLIEMGTRTVDQLAEEMERRGYPESGRWVIYYGSPKRPNVLWASSRARAGLLADVAGMGGVKLVRTALRPFVGPGTLVLDPCCGFGRTGQVTARLGGTFLGMELNRGRAERAIASLEKIA